MEIPTLNIDIQRYRVAVMVLREIENGLSDPNTYKEMNLLNRMLTGHDLESEATKQAQDAAAESSIGRLKEFGIDDPQQARRIGRVLTVLASRADDPTMQLEDESNDNPDTPITIRQPHQE